MPVDIGDWSPDSNSNSLTVPQVRAGGDFVGGRTCQGGGGTAFGTATLLLPPLLLLLHPPPYTLPYTLAPPPP